ncbi:MAG: class I SAM-dependent methyltransferase [Deltaproteobacteria bacterium]|nr:class I SAM-dependent methyltransferase [Deltaproteobacteria bacterium]
MSSEDASNYDRMAAEHGWHGHEALFGRMHEFIRPRDTLLDMGIGTGLGALLFHRAGLEIHGFDRSREMLEICESKGFAAHLLKHDLRQVPFPYLDNFFNHIISLAVLNFYPDLAPVFKEAARIIRPHGIFGFTVEEQKPGQDSSYPIRASGDLVVTMYRHSDAHIRELLTKHGFTPLKDFEFLADRYPADGMDLYFKAYVAQMAEYA